MSFAPSSTQRAGNRSLLRHGDFVKLWAGETVSQFGTQITFLALPLIAATTLNVTPFEFGMLATIEFLPFIVLSLPAGVWVDRLRRRPILIAGDIVRAVSLGSIPIAFAFDALTIWQLYAVGFVNGCATVFFDVAYQSYLPALVDRNQIVEGNAKLETSRSAAQITGPGAAGVLVGVVTAPFAILLDAISFVVSAVFLVGIRKHEPSPTPQLDASGRRPSMRTEIMEGLRYVGGHRYLRNIAATTGSSNFFGNIAQAIFILYLVRELAFTPELIGLAFSLGAVGFLIGALSASRIANLLGVGPTIVASALIFGPSVLLIAIAPRDAALPFIAASGFLNGFGGAVYNINQVSLRQAITPERMQGRMNATMRFIVWGAIPIGTTLGGFLGGVIGLLPTIWISAIGSLFAFLPVALSPVRSIREMPSPVDESGPASPEPQLATEQAEDGFVTPPLRRPYADEPEA